MTITAYYYNAGVPQEITPTTGGIADPYPTSVYTTAGTRIFYGNSYDMSAVGLYRFFDEANGTVLNKITLSDFTGGTDIYKFMGGISANHLHGTTDNSYSYQSVSNNGRTRKWRSQCGFISGYCNWILPQIGHVSRVINVSEIVPSNNYDTGHLVVESKHGDDWRMWDITNGCYFTHNGVHLSTSDFITQIANGGTFPTKISLDNDVKFNSDSIYGIDLQIYAELKQATASQQETWYRRVFQKTV